VGVKLNFISGILGRILNKENNYFILFYDNFVRGPSILREP
jgi:hypothetical protein